MTEAELLILKEAVDLADKALTQLETVQNPEVKRVAQGLHFVVGLAKSLLG